MIISGLIVYPRLFKPEAYDDGSAPKFSCSVLIAKDDPKAANLIQIVKDLINTKLGGETPEDRYMAFKDGDKSKNPEFAGYWEIRCKSDEDKRPGVVDGMLAPVIDPDLIRGGDMVRVDIRPYAYFRKYRGIGFDLQNVQYCGKGPKPLGSARKRPEDAFEAIPGTETATTQKLGGFLD